jgi:hypothetical protein
MSSKSSCGRQSPRPRCSLKRGLDLLDPRLPLFVGQAHPAEALDSPLYEPRQPVRVAEVGNVGIHASIPPTPETGMYAHF